MMGEAEREAMVAFLASIPSTLSVTLRYNAPTITLDRIRRDLRDLHAKVDRAVLGKRFNTSDQRSSYWAVVEKLDTNPHVHAGWRFPTLDHARHLVFMLDGAELWRNRYAPGGTHDVQLYRPNDYRFGTGGWAGYACKALWSTDHVILSAVA